MYELGLICHNWSQDPNTRTFLQETWFESKYPLVEHIKDRNRQTKQTVDHVSKILHSCANIFIKILRIHIASKRQHIEKHNIDFPRKTLIITLVTSVETVLKVNTNKFVVRLKTVTDNIDSFVFEEGHIVINTKRPQIYNKARWLVFLWKTVKSINTQRLVDRSGYSTRFE